MVRAPVLVAIFGGGALAVAGAIGGLYLLATSPTVIGAQFDREMQSTPATRAISEVWPEEVAALRERYVAASTGPDAISPARRSELVRDWGRDLIVRRFPAAAQASDDMLQVLLADEVELLRYLQATSVTACAERAMTGNAIPQDAEGQEILWRVVQSRVQAIDSGETAPVGRASASDADWRALWDAGRRLGMSEEALGSLADGSIGTVGAELQCQRTIDFLHSITMLDADRGARIYADLIVASVEAA